MKNKKKAAGLGKKDILKHIGVVAVLAVVTISVTLAIGSGKRITTDYVEKPTASTASSH